MAYNPVRRWIANRVARLGVLPFLYRRQVLRFESRCRSTKKTQLDLLARMIHFGRDSSFGKDFGFSSIQTVADFRRQLPIAGYDHFVPYIDRVAHGETTALFPANEEILTFVQTSATTGHPKLFPANATWFRHYQQGWDVWGVKALTDHPQVFGAPILQVSAPWRLGTTPAGHNITVSSALIERYQSHFIKKHYALPTEVTLIRESNARSYVIARLAARGPIGLMSTVTPSWFLRIAECVQEFAPILIRDLYQGTIDPGFDIPSEIRKMLEWKVRKPMPQLARRLENQLSKAGKLYPKDLWKPELISCWLGGTVGFASKRIPEWFGDVPMRDQGLLSSEGRHTLPILDGVPYGPLAIDENYYEFLPADERDSTQPTVMEAHELEVGKDYKLIFSTFGGLYRYDIGDIVRCVDFFGEAPVLEFLQKVDGYCDIEGEKLSAHMVCAAISFAETATGISLPCFSMAPLRPTGSAPCYALVVEEKDLPNVPRGIEFVRIIDAELKRMVLVYGNARNSRILGAPQLVRVENGTWQRVVNETVKGKPAGDIQFKHKPLVADLEFVGRQRIVDIHDSATSGERRAA